MPAIKTASSSKRGAPKQRGVKRAKSGCYTCRIRRKKCDEQPDGSGRCMTCIRLRLECLGFGANRPDWLRESRTVADLREKIKSFLAAQEMIKGHSGTGPCGVEPEHLILHLTDDYSSAFESQPTPTLPSAGPSRPRHIGLRESHNVVDLREKIKSFLAAQEMIKGHFGPGPRGVEPEHLTLHPTDDYSLASEGPSTPTLPSAGPSRPRHIPSNARDDPYAIGGHEYGSSLTFTSPALASSFGDLYTFVLPDDLMNNDYIDLPRNPDLLLHSLLVDQIVQNYTERVVKAQYLVAGSANGISTSPRRSELSTLAEGKGSASVAARISYILGNSGLYRELLSKRDSDAQMLLDVFQWVLDDAHLAEDLRRQLIVATQRLSIKSGLYPICYELKDVVQDNQGPVAGGGFADIYKGSFGGQVVCLKTFRVYQVSRLKHVAKQFSKEILLWGQLSHPNVLPIYGLYEYNKRLCIVAPWMHNGDITIYLESNPMADRRSLTLDVANGLQYLYQNSIIHGDLKGDNILIDEQGRARLCDFGIASICDSDIRGWTTQSSIGSKGGSTRWQAPELHDESDEEVQNTVFSDVYAFGGVCYQIFTGKVPFYQFSRDATIISQVKRHKTPLRPDESGVPWQEWGLTESIWQLMEDCWKAAPEERPAVQKIIERMAPLVQQGERTTGGGVVTPTHFRRSISKPPDDVTIAALDKLCSALSPPQNKN
ncbi:hypothetical protein DXG01_011040 [Tephrocybe rancida]|nr:hypothetical protein DXG01_011040 [Tephrocybe rancida]